MFNKLNLVSMYLHEAVGGAHQIGLHLTEGKPGHYEGTVQLDPNRCSLDAFGDRAGCTKIAVQSVDAEGTAMRTHDPAHLGRVIIALRWEGQEGEWALVHFPRAEIWYLVVKDRGEQVNVVPLYPARIFVAEDPVETRAKKLMLVSTYQGEAVGGAHAIKLNLKPALGASWQYEGTIQLDPNTCTLNEFGDRGMCTLMWSPPHEVQATQLRLADPAGLGRSYYELAWEGIQGHWALIVFTGGNGWYLVAEKEGTGRRVVPLYPAEAFHQDPLHLLQTRIGQPIRDLIERGDLDEMRKEAANIRAALNAMESQGASCLRGLATATLESVRVALDELEKAIKSTGG